ncbi:MAG: AmmeMemoRadiSam system protein B [Candidatus Sumerlaeota bacterium]|nr:AmmeMemoRadiSam system protein B [Candidatus Sumerlaeota bacterium]
MDAKKIRPAVQAGRFYPEDREELESAVQSYLRDAKKATLDSLPRALLAPHAGYDFSGATAGCAYRQIEGMEIERVVAVAPSHHAHFVGGSIYDGEGYATPLGVVPLDVELIADLRRTSTLFRHAPLAEAQEHSLEVQLPFLQVGLGSFRLVPILMGDQSEENAMAMAEALLGTLERHLPVSTIFVASSDLYHGYDYDECRVMDRRFEETLRWMEPRRLLREVSAGSCMACGAGPIAAVMEMARRVGATQARVLRQTTSRDANPDYSSGYVVGYAAAVFV